MSNGLFESFDQNLREVRETSRSTWNHTRELMGDLTYIAVGGAALAAARAGEKVLDAARRGEEMATRAGERAREAVTEARDQAEELRDRVEREIEGPDTRPYEERTVEELYGLAAERDIDGRSQMNKADLIAALRAER